MLQSIGTPQFRVFTIAGDCGLLRCDITQIYSDTSPPYIAIYDVVIVMETQKKRISVANLISRMRDASYDR